MESTTEILHGLLIAPKIDSLKVSELDDAISTRKDILMSLPEGSDEYLETLGMIGDLHAARFKQLPKSKIDLDEAIDLWREFCRICPRNSDRRLSALDRFAGLLQQRSCPRPGSILEGFIFQSVVFRGGSIAKGHDLGEAISTQREALSICPLDHAMYTSLRVKLGSLLLAQTDDLLQLRESIQLLQSVLCCWTSKSTRRYILLNNLATALTSLVGACSRETVKNEVEHLVEIHRELAVDYSGEMGPAFNFWKVTATWLQRLCEPPLLCLGRAQELAEIAVKLLSLDPNSEAAKQWRVFSMIAMEYHDGTAEKIHVPEPNHESYLNCFKQYVKEQNFQIMIRSDENVSPIYNKDIDDQKERLSYICQNLAYLSYKTQSSDKQDNHILATLNLASLLRLQQLYNINSRFFYAALDYQLYAKQHIASDHEFYNALNMALATSLTHKYSISNNLKDYEILTKIYFEMGNVQHTIGPSMLSNPWEDTLEPYGHKGTSAEETSDSLIQYAYERISNARTADSLYYLAERLLIHSNTFYSQLQNTKHLKDVTLLVDEIANIDAKKLKGSVNHTSIALAWFGYTGDLDYLDRALKNQKAHRNSYIKALHERFLQKGNMEDLEKAIALADIGDQVTYRSALLGRCLNTRYYLTGDAKDLQESLASNGIDIDQCEAYLYRYEKFGHVEDLNKAFEMGSLGEKEELLENDEIYDDNRRDILYCKGLIAKYILSGNESLLTTALSTIEDTESHSLPVMLPHTLHCHASILATTKNSDSIIQALHLQKKALSLLPASNIYYSSFLGLLGKLFCEKYHFTKVIEDLISSIEALKEATTYMNISLPIHQLNLGNALQICSVDVDFEKSLGSAKLFFRNSATSHLAPLKIQYEAAISWAKAAENDHKEALYAYEYIMDVLPQIVSLGLDINDRHTIVVSLTKGVAGDAAAYAIRHGFVEKAVEFLEHGRSIFWQQVMQLHSSLDELKLLNPNLANQLLSLARDLNISSFKTKQDDVPERYMEFLARESQKRHDLAGKFNRLVKEARSIPGCENLLQPPSYAELSAAASNSILVFLSTTVETTFAIVMKDPSSPPQALQLPEMNMSHAQKLAGLLQITLRSSSREVRDSKVIERAGKLYVPFNMALEEKRMYTLLSELWDKIVKPVIRFMNLVPSDSPPRITWCCAGILATLPIHAAGIYRGPKKICLSDFAISSYTPTLSNLVPNEPLGSVKNPEVLLAGLVESPGHPPLPNVFAELDAIEDALHKLSGSTCKSLKGKEATGNNILAKLSSAHMIHLACHGAASPNPLESALILYDGQLKIEKLIRTPFMNAKLAFLSACQTAKINPEEPDESIHIASAMLNTGFKSVIGTMWSIDDNDAPSVAKSFYENLVTGDREINLAGSALALHNAIKKFKATGISPLRWAPFIHMGL